MRIVNSYEKIAANVQIDFDKGIQAMAEGVQTAGSVMKENDVNFEAFAASVAKVAETTRLEGKILALMYSNMHYSTYLIAGKR